jgi:hypothetical protein
MLSKPVSIYKSCTIMLIYRIQVKRHCFIKLPTALERGQKLPQIPLTLDRLHRDYMYELHSP